MTADELDEVVARAICANDFDGDANVFDQCSSAQQGNYRQNARAVRKAISAAGMEVVPKEPTDHQLREGQKAWMGDTQRRSTTLYRAMVRAGAVGGVDAG